MLGVIRLLAWDLSSALSVSGCALFSGFGSLSPKGLHDPSRTSVNRSSAEGMPAVGTVVMNRMSDREYPRTVCGVVGQKNQFAPGVLYKPMKKVARRRWPSVAEAVLRRPPSRRAEG